MGKEFEITGVTLKNELKIGFFFGICFIILWSLPVYIYYVFNHLESIIRIPFYIFFGAMFLGLGWSLVILKILGKRMRVKYLFEISEQSIKIKIVGKSLLYVFDYVDINLVSLVGTAENMRFFKIISSNKKLKLRLGTYGLAPFSESIDIQTMDAMVFELELVLKRLEFVDRKVKTANKVFEYRYLKQ